MELPEYQPEYDPTQGGVQLPFYAPSYWVLNGETSMKPLGGPRYYGGWLCLSSIVAAAADDGLQVYPVPGQTEIEYAPHGGKEDKYQAARVLVVAPFAQREWGETDEGRVAPYTKGASPRIQVLALLGYLDDQKHPVVWGPIILKARGYQVGHLKRAIKENLDAFSRAAKTHYPEQKIAPNLFWQFIGTFGQLPEFKDVTMRNKSGTAAITPTITPITTKLPPEITKEVLESRYIGRDAAERMRELKDMAAEWLNAAYNRERPAGAAAKHRPEGSAIRPDVTEDEINAALEINGGPNSPDDFPY